MQNLAFCLSVILASVGLYAAPPQQVPIKLLSDTRFQFQSRFAKAQQALGADPSKAPHEAQANLERYSKDLAKLQADALAVMNERYIYWNNETYWRNYWVNGPSAKFVVGKLRAQIDATTALQVPPDAPFTKPDINTMQKTLDAVRICFELDEQLQIMEKQLASTSRLQPTPARPQQPVTPRPR